MASYPPGAIARQAAPQAICAMVSRMAETTPGESLPAAIVETGEPGDAVTQAPRPGELERIHGAVPGAIDRLARVIERGSDRDAIAAAKVVLGVAGYVAPTGQKVDSRDARQLADMPAHELAALVAGLQHELSDRAKAVGHGVDPDTGKRPRGRPRADGVPSGQAPDSRRGQHLKPDPAGEHDNGPKVTVIDAEVAQMLA